MVAQNIAFGIVAVLTALSGLRVVTTQNVIHAALYLAGTLMGVAVTYLLLAAEFLFVVQVLVYIGAVVVLFVFGIMLIRPHIGKAEGLTNTSWPVAALVSVSLALLIGWVLIDGFGSRKLPDDMAVVRTGEVGDAIFSTYLIPFEVTSVLLLAALVGAIVLARKE